MIWNNTMEGENILCLFHHKINDAVFFFFFLFSLDAVFLKSIKYSIKQMLTIYYIHKPL